MTFRTLLALCFCLHFALSNCLTQSSVVFRNNIYDLALESAKTQDKLVFIDTWAEWCGPCKKMEPVFRDARLANYFNQNFINVRIDMGTESTVKELVQNKYDIFFLPTLMLLDSDGNVKFRIDNQILKAEELLNIAKAVNAPIEYVARQTVQSKADSRLIDPSKRTDKIQVSDDLMIVKNKNSGASTLAKRPEINDPNYSDDPNEKILYTLGASEDLPPEILFEEAYFRFSQLNDGSYNETVKKYLDSQSDWSTDKNLKFVFDFIINTDTPQFKYLITNRSLFESRFGKEEVGRSIGFLVHQKLFQAIDRPDIEEATLLFSYIKPDNKDNRKMAEEYLHSRSD